MMHGVLFQRNKMRIQWNHDKISRNKWCNFLFSKYRQVFINFAARVLKYYQQAENSHVYGNKQREKRCSWMTERRCLLHTYSDLERFLVSTRQAWLFPSLNKYYAKQLKGKRQFYKLSILKSRPTPLIFLCTNVLDLLPKNINFPFYYVSLSFSSYHILAWIIMRFSGYILCLPSIFKK